MSNASNKSMNILESIYKIQKGKNTFGDSSLFNSYSLNIIIFVFMIILCYFFYARINITQSFKNWNVEKCNPKYFYFSGYIKPEKNMTSFESTLHNFRDCLSNGYVEAIKEFENEMNIDYKDKEKRFFFEYGKNKKYKKNNDIVQDDAKVIVDLLGDEIDDISLNNSSRRIFMYNKLGVLGVYIDQLDELINYIFKYSKNYLTYLYFYRLKDYMDKKQSDSTDEIEKEESKNKLSKVKKILDDHFDGPNIY